MMILPYQQGRIRHPRRRAGASSTPPPPPPPGDAPVLVLAVFAIDEFGAGVVTLGFDVPVDLAGMAAGEIQVVDGPTGTLYVGSGAVTVLSPSSFTLAMVAGEGPGGGAVLLTASSSTGIVAVVGGAAWAGTSGSVELPIPTPPPPAVVIAAIASGFGCRLQFDRPVAVVSTSPDDAVLFDGMPAFGVNNYAPDLLGFECAQFLLPGSTWEIVRQPAWLATGVEFPQGGTFPELLRERVKHEGTKTRRKRREDNDV